MRREDNPASLSLSNTQMTEIYGSQDGEMGVQPPKNFPQSKATATLTSFSYSDFIAKLSGESSWRQITVQHHV